MLKLVWYDENHFGSQDLINFHIYWNRWAMLDKSGLVLSKFSPKISGLEKFVQAQTSSFLKKQ